VVILSLTNVSDKFIMIIFHAILLSFDSIFVQR
jgi:hypothetical protein